MVFNSQTKLETNDLDIMSEATDFDSSSMVNSDASDFHHNHLAATTDLHSTRAVSSYNDNNNNINQIPTLNAAKESRDTKRSIDELMRLVKNDDFDPNLLTNDEIIELMLLRQVSVYKLESILGKTNAKRCVQVRRQYLLRTLELLDELEADPSQEKSQQMRIPRADVFRQPQSTEFDYSRVVGACCESVVGYVRLPVGLVGPLKMDDQIFYVPMATTEGCLVASASRGISALTRSGGVITEITKDCMTRAPVVRFHDPEIKDAVKNRIDAMKWLEDPENKQKIISAFGSTSNHTNLLNYNLIPAGRELHIRFEAQTGDAMGMNMCSKGAEMALRELQRIFPTMDVVSLSGNTCSDKKASAINWIRGRGKSVQCNASLPADIVEKTLKVSVDSLIKAWESKVMIGGALAGNLGGFNCHAANIVSAIFIATGQDAAQVVSSSNCLLKLEKNSRGSLEVLCYMPSIECGTVGGGTILQDQANYLQLMGLRGATIRPSNVQHELETSSDHKIQNSSSPNISCDTRQKPQKSSPSDINDDTNACKLARVICSTVMAAELSLLASLAEGTLVKSHMTYNRSTQPCKVV